MSLIPKITFSLIFFPRTFVGQVYPDFYYVFEFCEHDLAGLLFHTQIQFEVGEIKNVLQQILSGLYFMHNNQVSKT